jgi:hypothetical protein
LTIEIFGKEYDLKLNGKFQIVKDGLVIYPMETFTLDLNNKENYTIHHFNGSWTTSKISFIYKYLVHMKYYSHKFIKKLINSINTLLKIFKN